MLYIEQDVISKDVFNKFIQEVYNKMALKDYNHLQDQHWGDESMIKRALQEPKSCNSDECLISKRHPLHENISNKSLNHETRISFYSRLYNFIHLWLYHDHLLGESYGHKGMFE